LYANEIIAKVRTLVDSIRDQSSDCEPIIVAVEGFEFSIGKEHYEY